MMNTLKPLTSTDNPGIKLLQKLGQKKYRKSENLFLIENLTIIFDALKSGYDFDSIYLTEEFINKHPDEVDFLLKKSKSNSFFKITEKINNYYSCLDTPSGITAVYEKRKNKHDNGSVVFLNDIRDPGNIGTILRSAISFGFKNIILDKTCAELYNPKTIQASKDAIFKLNIYEDGDLDWLNKSKLPIYITSSHKGTALQEFKPEKDFCLVLGNETNGVSQEIERLAVKAIKIEMNNDMESINVSSAAAILFYILS